MEFSRQEYWSGLPLPSPLGYSRPGIETTILAGGLFTTSATWEVPNKDKEEEHFFQWKGDKDFIFRFIIEHSDRDIQ